MPPREVPPVSPPPPPPPEPPEPPLARYGIRNFRH